MVRQVNGHLGTFASINDLTVKFPPSESIGCSANIGTAIPYTKAWCDGRTWANVNANGVQAIVGGPWQITPQNYGAVGDGVTDDTVALQNTILAAIAQGDGVVNLGNSSYLCSSPIGVLINKPIKIIGYGAWLIMSPNLSGDLLSFSNTWYGSDITTLIDNSTGTGTSYTAKKWTTRTSRKNGVWLQGFRVTGDRSTTQIQNGIVFYDRNDNVILRDVEIDFVKGNGLVLSGFPSNQVANSASVMRESFIENVHIRWCGDSTTARPAVVFNSTDKGALSSDDACNYTDIVGMKVIFSDGMAFQSNCHNLNSNSFSNNKIQLVIDAPQNLTSASSTGSQASITNGVLTIGNGGTITGTFSVGQFLENPSVPIGTYISAILTGSGGAGTYQLSNKFENMSTLTVSSGGNMATLRCYIPMMQIGGGHVGDRWDVCVNGSNTLGTGAPAITMNQNTLHASTAKVQACELEMFVGSLDVGLVFTTVNSLTGRLRVRNAVTTIVSLNITQSVVIDTELINGSSDLVISGVITNLYVRPGGQDVVTSLPTASKYPNCILWVKSGTTWTRNASDGSSWYTT